MDLSIGRFNNLAVVIATTIFILINTIGYAQSSNHLSTQNSNAEYMITDSTVFQLLLGGGVNNISNESQLPVITGGTDCGQFTGGNGFSGYFNFGGGYMLINKMLGLEARFLIESRPAILTTETANYSVLNQNNDYQALQLEHNFEAGLIFGGLSLGANFYPLEEYPFSIGAAWDWSSPLFSSDYTQTDEILEPSNVRFEGSKTRIVGTGDYDNLQSSYGVTASVRYDLPAGENITLIPEISYRYGLNSISTAGIWDQNILRMGVNISFDVNLYEKVYGRVSGEQIETNQSLASETQPVKDTLSTLAPTDEVMQAQEVETMIRDISFDKLAIHETIVSQTYPILPYIFFDSGSSEIPTRYSLRSNVSTFSESKLPKSTLDIYYSTLDIIASRMKSQDGTLTITGYHNGIELSSVESRENLSENRAMAVKKYFTDKWEIDGDRIALKSENLPAISTSNVYIEGPEENSRVEISSDTPELLQPIVFRKFLEYNLSGGKLTPILDVKGSENVESIEVSIQTDGRELFQFTGSLEDLQRNGFSYTQSQLADLATVLNDSENQGLIGIEANLVDSEGRSTFFSTNTPIKKTLSDYEVGRINLIVFDFDKSSISPDNMKMLNMLSTKDDWKNSDITITGSTDKLGEAEYNQNLSLQRAKATEEYLRKINTNLPEIKVMGLGSSVLPFDNDLPEGRFYCRTVLIEVKTPLDKTD